ncbi:DUF6389 family protein [Achromobacter ruhlandii]|uniref:DUF6389 family protein n=1 Tax=Achromobacter ruhlandii TaxID=72557 RepID=UPI000C257D89|nr:DUF6389 family protein [Achromobacter ruhlandii]MCV6796608.1 DUF6389 family protein [Achromobacter ruhlandii]MCV6811414.1 DUF6389 family protein [Achromobacter ruhlandii]MCV6819878.1 DUF6389 family protein [Achromobacter ruhlandii]PJM87243.1 hypothetical protein CV044_20415 [Achromobacter ruhlandii]
MNQHDYQTALRRELDAHTDAALRVLAGLFPRLPEKAREIQFGIFPDQDGEGTFSVVIGLDGPDLYVLNKAIEGHRNLFDVVHGETGLTPPVPMFGRDPGFCVQDVIADTAADWIEALWERGGRAVSPLPACIYADEDYGTTTPRGLSADAAPAPR